MFTGGASPVETASMPEWAEGLEEGTFTDVGQNVLLDVAPEGWPMGEAASTFVNYSSGTFCRDFSTHGGVAVYGSGHLTPNTALWAGVGVWDLGTALWVMRNVPGAPLLDNTTDYNEYGESTKEESLGHPSPPHTYDGIIYQPKALGGGPDGSMLRCFFAGAPWKNAVHQFDLSKESDPPTRVVDAISFGGTDTSSYPMSAADEGRGGFWVLTYTGSGPLTFVPFSTWEPVQYSGVQYNVGGFHTMLYIPAPWDCLVGMGIGTAALDEWAAWVCPIVSGVPQGFTRITMTGDGPAAQQGVVGVCGGVWSTILNCIVSYEANGSDKVHRLTPPAPANLLTGAWVWTSETLTGVGGATPSSNTANNGARSRFVEAPIAKCFLWCDSNDDPMQAWVLNGMRSS